MIASRIIPLILLVSTAVSAQPLPVTDRLRQNEAEFREELIRVTDGVFTAVGYGVQPVSMIVGDDGVIIVDTGIDTATAETVLAQFRQITDKPVKAIIYTHGHGDHTGGTAVFKGPDTQVWGRAGFGVENRVQREVGLEIQNLRAQRQSGMAVPRDQVINLGIGQYYVPRQEAGVRSHASTGDLTPENTFASALKKLRIAGVDLELVAANGETADQLYVWLPRQKVVFSGDNYYKSWPNLYAIRGTVYRDIRQWVASLDGMLDEEPEFLVPGHTRPILGKDRVTKALRIYRDAIQYVFDKTIEGMNKGLTPDQLVDYVELPEVYANSENLTPWYGHPDWAVRAIFNYYLGWFDGNPTNLFPLPPREEALRMAKLAGGEDRLHAQLVSAMAGKDWQWALQLSDYLMALRPESGEIKLMRADILTGLADIHLTTTARNYYLTVAQELRRQAKPEN